MTVHPGAPENRSSVGWGYIESTSIAYKPEPLPFAQTKPFKVKREVRVSPRSGYPSVACLWPAASEERHSLLLAAPSMAAWQAAGLWKRLRKWLLRRTC